MYPRLGPYEVETYTALWPLAASSGFGQPHAKGAARATLPRLFPFLPSSDEISADAGCRRDPRQEATILASDPLHAALARRLSAYRDSA